MCALLPPSAHLGYVVQGVAVPLVDRELKPVTLCGGYEDADVFFVLGTWVFRCFWTRNDSSISPRSFTRKDSVTMATFTSLFTASLGRHTRSTWLVDVDRHPFSDTVKADLNGVKIEFLPTKRKLAARATRAAIDCFVAHAFREFEQRTLAAATRPSSPLSTKGSDSVESVVDDSYRAAVSFGVASAITDDDLKYLKRIGVGWQPSKMRFTLPKNLANREHAPSVCFKISASAKKHYLDQPSRKITKSVKRTIFKMKDRIVLFVTTGAIDDDADDDADSDDTTSSTAATAT
jgi:hypothetical protein